MKFQKKCVMFLKNVILLSFVTNTFIFKELFNEIKKIKEIVLNSCYDKIVISTVGNNTIYK